MTKYQPLYKKLHIFAIVYKTAPQITAEIFFQVKFPLFGGNYEVCGFFQAKFLSQCLFSSYFRFYWQPMGVGRWGLWDLETWWQNYRGEIHRIQCPHFTWNEMQQGNYSVVSLILSNGFRDLGVETTPSLSAPPFLCYFLTHSQEKWEHIQSLLLTKMKL